jgi:hypothetical protein
MTAERYLGRGFHNDNPEESVPVHPIAATEDIHHLRQPLSAAEIGQQIDALMRRAAEASRLALEAAKVVAANGAGQRLPEQAVFRVRPGAWRWQSHRCQ